MSKLVVFEGPDNVGKTTIIKTLEKNFKKEKIKFKILSFPGKEEGTLGNLIYKIHHNPKKYKIDYLSPYSLQTLHVASHIDIIERQIKPFYNNNTLFLLDRYWWSTVTYGKLESLSSEFLKKLIALENLLWDNISPSIIFLINRPPNSKRSKEYFSYSEMWGKYRDLARSDPNKTKVRVVNNSDLTETINIVQEQIKKLISPSQTHLVAKTVKTKKKRDDIWKPTKPTIVLDTYWYFATERQNIFFKRYKNEPYPWSNDPIFLKYKFTNAYRASDRVSQYLIKNVIYKGDQSAEEVFFRIILFKLFNRIETWEKLSSGIGSIKYSEYSFEKYNNILNESINKGSRIYSAAYIMSSGSNFFGYERKHSNHLRLIELMINDQVPQKIISSKSMQDVFTILRSYPTIGDFLAYQLVTDINYSNLTDFSEMSFVVPGPGALDGIRKCFSNLGGLNEVEIIKLMAENQDMEFERLNLSFKNLWGRRLQLIDCQNLFCEVDKYSRIAHPEIIGISGRTRIKQIFSPNEQEIEYWYPPKWGINALIEKREYTNGKLF